MLRFYPVLEVALVAVLTAVINYPVIFMRCLSYKDAFFINLLTTP